MTDDLSARPDPAQRSTREDARVDAQYARSWQLVSAMAHDQFDRAQLGRADAVVIDLEDAVDDSNKPAARADVVEWLSSGGRAWVRINDVTVDAWEDDVEALRGVPGLQGVVLAKVEAPAQVTDTYHRLGAQTPVVPLLESALGIEVATAVASAQGSFRLAFGSGDYRKDTGTENVAVAMAYPRTRLVLASRIGGLQGPIDGPTPLASHSILREQIGDAVALGMTAKLCLDHDQPAVINEDMAPSGSDVAWADEFLADFDARGRVVRDGSDKPRLGRAEKIRERALIFGIEPR